MGVSRYSQRGFSLTLRVRFFSSCSGDSSFSFLEDPSVSFISRTSFDSPFLRISVRVPSFFRSCPPTPSSGCIVLRSVRIDRASFWLGLFSPSHLSRHTENPFKYPSPRSQGKLFAFYGGVSLLALHVVRLVAQSSRRSGALPPPFLIDTLVREVL